MTTRRGFLEAILATATAPTIVRGGILMPIKKIILPTQKIYTGSYTRLFWPYVHSEDILHYGWKPDDALAEMHK